MADYIDRQATIDRFENLSYDDWNQGVSTTWANAFSECADMIRELPPSDVQTVRHGFWIEDRYNDLDFVCSECGEPCANMVMGMPRDRYCKWCGARMDGEQND